MRECLKECLSKAHGDNDVARQRKDEMLRRQGYQGSLIMLSSDASLPYDRPNLSKDYLAGTIPFEYVPPKDERFYAENGIETRLGRAVRELDVRGRQIVLT